MAVVLFFIVLGLALIIHSMFWIICRRLVPAEKLPEFQDDNRAYWTVCGLLTLGEFISANLAVGSDPWTIRGITIALTLLLVLVTAARLHDWYLASRDRLGA